MAKKAPVKASKKSARPAKAKTRSAGKAAAPSRSKPATGREQAGAPWWKPFI